MPRSATLPLALLVALGPLASARGEFIPWKYNWSRSQAVLHSDAPGTGKVTLTDEISGSAEGSSDLVATNLRVESTAEPETPDVFTDAEYSLTLFLLDESSGNSGTLTFGGAFNGEISSLSANLFHTFSGETTQSIILGEHQYTVDIGPYTPPGPPGSTNAGAVSATARVEVKKVQPAPEPSTLVLSCLAMPFMGYAAWKRRRRQQG